MSELEGSKTSFTVHIFYRFLIFKNIFSLDPRPGFRKPQGFLGILSFTPTRSSPSLKSRVPRPAGGSP